MRASGRAAESIDCSLPEHLVQPPAGGVGEREQPQRLAGRRAVDDDHVPLAGLDVALEHQQQNSSSPPGGTVSSSAAIRSTPRSISSPPSHSRDRAPVVLELVLGLDLLGVQALADLRRLAADLGLQHVGERVRRVGGDHERARAVGRAAARRGGRDGRLADAALARVEDRPRPHASRRVYGRFLTVTSPAARGACCPARSVAVTVDVVVAGLLRRRPGQRLGPAAEHARVERGHDASSPRVTATLTREIFESLKRSLPDFLARSVRGEHLRSPAACVR